MINLIDKTGIFPDDEFYERKNFIVDTHLCTHMETPSMEYQMKKTLTNQLMESFVGIQ